MKNLQLNIEQRTRGRDTAGGSDGSDGQKKYSDGFDALKNGYDSPLNTTKLNSDGNSDFDANDSGWNTVKVWVDANADGQTQTTELKTLTELGITSINLNATTQSGMVNSGNEVRALGHFTINGQTQAAQAVDFIANPAGSTFTVDAPSGQLQGVTINTEATPNSNGGGQAASAYSTTNTTGTTLNAATLGVNNLYGNSGNDTLIGDAGANWLAGGLGADTMNAGDGDDVLLFDAQDTLDGGDGDDIAMVMGDAGVVLNLAQSHIEVAVGGRGDDILIGGGRSTVYIKAGEGDDIVIGGAANDGEWRKAA